MQLIKITVVILGAALISACSSSGGASNSNEEVELVIQTEVFVVDEADFVGTWATACLPSAATGIPSRQESFVYDGDKALFITQNFSDELCASLASFVTRSGTMDFGVSFVESTYGVTSNEFTFTSDGSLADDFLDIIYTREELLYFGSEDSRPSTSQAPVALDVSRTYNYSGVPDFSIVDSLSIPVTVGIEIESFDGIADSVNGGGAISLDSLTLNVSIYGLEIVMNRVGDKWIGETTVAPNSTVDIDVTWAEIFNGNVLQLAVASTTIDVDTQQIQVIVNANSFFTGFDTDQDGVSNLQERQQGTDPFDASSN